MTTYPLTISAQNYYHLAMEKEMPKIRVVDLQSGQTLFECSIQESDKAYQFAAQMEDMQSGFKSHSTYLKRYPFFFFRP